MVIGFGDRHLLKKDVGHISVVVLAGMDQHLANVWARRNCARNRGGFDELRPGADDGDYLQNFLPLFTNTRFKDLHPATKIDQAPSLEAERLFAIYHGLDLMAALNCIQEWQRLCGL